ncbi:MAG: methyltransferase [Candidatus Methylarchaceae archaeon HK02M1]|nr:methyltransferase [Candidatus Methylarchaceae archaeon HK02M1]
MEEIPYKPAEDTFLLARAIGRYSGKVKLEIGIGSGYIFIELSKSKNPLVVGTDISVKALREVLIRLKSIDRDNVELVHCDGASPFRKGCFDLIIFNPPYLPSEEILDSTVDGGKEGIEAMEKFIDHSLNVVSNSGSIVFILSTLSNYVKVVKILKDKGFEVVKKESLKLFFEEIFVIEASKIG